jgi:hypothetical protein
LAIDYPQLLSRVLPVRMINTAVGGSNSDALVKPMSGGTARIRQGERVLYGTEVSWGMGPYPGMRVTVHGETYTIDSVAEHPPTRNTELNLVESARADYEGTDYQIEPGWEVRVARYRPQVVCLMFVNDGAMPEARLGNWREMVRRTRAMGAVPVLMSPFPVDDATHGGNHPGFHEKVRQNAAAVRALAEAERAWFVDVFQLTLALPPETSALELSLFVRVRDPARLGTRDLPGAQSALRLSFQTADGQELGDPWQATGGADSYQWRKNVHSVPVLRGARTAALTLAAVGSATVQYAGVFAAAQPGSRAGP